MRSGASVDESCKLERGNSTQTPFKSEPNAFNLVSPELYYVTDITNVNYYAKCTLLDVRDAADMPGAGERSKQVWEGKTKISQLL